MTLLPFLPEIALLGLAIVILGLEMGREGLAVRPVGRGVFHTTWAGLALILILEALGSWTDSTTSLGSYRTSRDIGLWKQIFLLATFATVLLSPVYFRTGGNARGALTRPGTFYALLLLCTVGMFALISAKDLLTFYLGLELATLPLYALAAFQPKDGDSVEAGSKYMLMGGFSSALSLFGISFLYGSAGSLGFDALAAAAQGHGATGLLQIGVYLLLGGLGFKLAMAPLHMWAPDVYQGAPTPVMAFLSVASKAAAVAATALLFLGPLEPLRPSLIGLLSVSAVLSMVIGNLGAMRQTNLRRFVAYSSIAQVGYFLVGFTGEPGTIRVAFQYNLLAYGVTSFALYFIISIVGREGPETLSSLRGLSRRSPALAVLLALAMFSLAGLPPLAGFLGKFLLFSTAAGEGHYVLVALAVGNAVVSFYYYMLLVKEAYLAPADEGRSAIVLSLGSRIGLAILALLLVVLGLCPGILGYLQAVAPAG
jgi:NADH-quinone oxidoreductase subunit N